MQSVSTIWTQNHYGWSHFHLLGSVSGACAVDGVPSSYNPGRRVRVLHTVYRHPGQLYVVRPNPAGPPSRGGLHQRLQLHVRRLRERARRTSCLRRQAVRSRLPVQLVELLRDRAARGVLRGESACCDRLG